MKSASSHSVTRWCAGVCAILWCFGDLADAAPPAHAPSGRYLKGKGYEITPEGLSRALKSSEMMTRYRAIIVIQSRDLRELSSALKPLMSDSKYTVKFQAMRALALWGDKDGVDELRKFVLDESSSSPLRVRGAGVLRTNGDYSGYDVIVDVFTRKDGRNRGKIGASQELIKFASVPEKRAHVVDLLLNEIEVLQSLYETEKGGVRAKRIFHDIIKALLGARKNVKDETKRDIEARLKHRLTVGIASSSGDYRDMCTKAMQSLED